MDGRVKKHELAPDLVIYEGDVRHSLGQIPDESVQCVVTSPPYWGLRDYGTAQWEGGDPDCRHAVGNQVQDSKAPGAIKSGVRPGVDASKCIRCGALRIDSQIGLEPTPEEYVASLVDVFREVRRVLRKDGVLWLNLGDSYAGSGGAGDWSKRKAGKQEYVGPRGDNPNRFAHKLDGIKPKDLVGIPWRVAFALQADGWYLRSAPPWIKDNPMPESVTDRPGTAHEYIFLLTKSQHYFYDVDAVRMQMFKGLAGSTFTDGKTGINGQGRVSQKVREDNPAGRNRRTNDWWNESLEHAIQHHLAYAAHLQHIMEHGGMVLDEDGDPLGFMVNTKPFGEAHFAVWPEDLVKPMILAGSSPKACPKCGAPWEREIGVPIPVEGRGSGNKERKVAREGERSRTNTHLGSSVPWTPTITPTTAWKPTCPCEGNDGTGKSLVMDLFHGSGTTGRVALRLGRAYWGCELNPEYVQMSIRARLSKVQTTLLGQV